MFCHPSLPPTPHHPSPPGPPPVLTGRSSRFHPHTPHSASHTHQIQSAILTTHTPQRHTDTHVRITPTTHSPPTCTATYMATRSHTKHTSRYALTLHTRTVPGTRPTYADISNCTDSFEFLQPRTGNERKRVALIRREWCFLWALNNRISNSRVGWRRHDTGRHEQSERGKHRL